MQYLSADHFFKVSVPRCSGICPCVGLHFYYLTVLLNSAAFKNCRLNRAICEMETSLGHAFSHTRWLVQLPKPQLSISLSMDNTRRVASGLPWGSNARWDTLALTNSMADAFGQVATQAPQPTHSAASMASSAVSWLMGIALASGAPPVLTDI